MNIDKELEPAESESTLDPKKLAKIEKEKKELLAALAGGDFFYTANKSRFRIEFIPRYSQQRHYIGVEILGDIPAGDLQPSWN